MDTKQNRQRPASRTPKKPTTEDWQLRTNTMMGSLGFLLFNEIMSDVVFVVGPQRVRIPAHQFILAIRSTVFHAMFYGALSTENEVQIPDIEPPAFRNLLQYLYIDKVEIAPDSVITTLYAAKKYAVLGLEKRCEELLGSSLKPENAFLLLTQARFFDASHLVELCLGMIEKQTQACLNAKCFLDIDYDTLEVVLRRDSLNVKEICLYEASMRWSQAECKRHDLAVTSENQRRVLKKCVRLIRYPVMSNQEFAEGPVEDGLLTDKEIAHVFFYINRNPKPVCEFLDKPRRRIITSSETVCDRFNHYYSNYNLSTESSSRILFQVDQSIFVSGFGLVDFDSWERLEYEVHIELIHTSSKTSIASNQTKLVRGYYNKPHRVLFKEPVDVLAHTDYCAVAIIKGVHNYGVQSGGLSKVTVECENGQKVTFQFFNEAHSDYTTVERGQIPQILFHG